MKIENRLENIINKILVGSAIIYSGHALAGDFSAKVNQAKNEIVMTYPDSTTGVIRIDKTKLNKVNKIDVKKSNANFTHYNNTLDRFLIKKDDNIFALVVDKDVYSAQITGPYGFQTGKSLTSFDPKHNEIGIYLNETGATLPIEQGYLGRDKKIIKQDKPARIKQNKSETKKEDDFTVLSFLNSMDKSVTGTINLTEGSPFTVDYDVANNRIGLKYEDNVQGNIFINTKEKDVNKRLIIDKCQCTQVINQRKVHDAKNSDSSFLIERFASGITSDYTVNISKINGNTILIHGEPIKGPTSVLLRNNEAWKVNPNDFTISLIKINNPVGSIDNLIQSLQQKENQVTAPVTVTSAVSTVTSAVSNVTEPVSITYVSPYIHLSSETDKQENTKGKGYIGLAFDTAQILIGGSDLKNKDIEKNGKFSSSESGLLINASPLKNLEFTLATNLNSTRIPKQETSQDLIYPETTTSIANGTERKNQTDSSYIYETKKELNSENSLDLIVKGDDISFKINGLYQNITNNSTNHSLINSQNNILQRIIEYQNGMAIGTTSSQDINIAVDSSTKVETNSEIMGGKASLLGRINVDDASVAIGPVGGILKQETKSEIENNLSILTAINGNTNVRIPIINFNENYPNSSTNFTQDNTKQNLKDKRIFYIPGAELQIESPNFYLASQITSLKQDDINKKNTDWTPTGNASLIYNGNPILYMYGDKGSENSNFGMSFIQSGNFDNLKSSEGKKFEASTSFNPLADEIIHKETLNQKVNSSGISAGYAMGITKGTQEKNHIGSLGYYGDKAGINVSYSSLDEKVSGEVLLKPWDYVVSIGGSKDKKDNYYFNLTIQ